MEQQIQTSIWHDGIMGLVVGDALGVPVEFMTRSQIKKSENGPVTGMRGFGTFNMPAGTWSDDSSMALATMCALTKGSIDLKYIMTLFRDWQDRGEFTPFGRVFDEGNTCREAIGAFKKCGNPASCGVTGEYANGNGALMRILPICLFVYQKVKSNEMTDDEAVKNVHNVAALTHNHLRSNMCCGVYYFLVKSILDNKDNNTVSLLDILQDGMDKARAFYGKDPQNAYEMKQLDRIWNLRKFVDTPEHEIKSSGYVIDTIEAALWCVINTNSFKDAALMAVNLGNDTDTVAAVTGGLAGLYYGFYGIPAEWRNSIRSVTKILAPCDAIAGIKVEP